MLGTKELVFDILEKVNGNSDKDWSEILEAHNGDVNVDTLRKAGMGIKLANEAGCISFEDNSDKAKYDKMYEAKRQFYDQRREYNKILTKEARETHMYDELIKAARSLNDLKPLNRNSNIVYDNEDNEAVLVLSDWHYGISTNNVWNRYDTDIAYSRIIELLCRTRNKLRHDNISKLHIILLGDMISGDCHVSIRVANTEDAVSQVMKVSEYIAEFIDELSCDVESIDVYSTWGNHARVIQNLSDSTHKDNMERIIPFWLEQRFKDNDRVNINYGMTEEFIRLNVLGNEICAVHGDLDSKNNSELVLSAIYRRLFNANMQYMISGHMHHKYTNEVAGIEHMIVGSLVGTDDYAKDKRLFSRPSQTMFIFGREGLDAIYNFDLH